MKALFKKLYQAAPLKRPAFTLLKRVWRPRESVFRHLHFRGDFRVNVDEQHSFRLRHYGYFLENEIFWAGLKHGHEQVSYSLWIKLVKDSRVILDVGANTGVYSLIARSLNSAAAVYAFEPVTRVFQKLETNRKLNGFDFATLEIALSNYDGDAIIFDTDAEHTYSVTVNKNTTSAGSNVVETKIKTTRLDTFIEARGLERVDLMKIDVETHEPEVLEGMGRYLRKFNPAILIEILDDEIGKRIEELVASNGYLYFNIDDHAGTIREVEHLCRSDFWNYLLCSPAIAAELGLTTSA